MSEELVKLALSLGWAVDRVMMYDEEGVEGWRWSHPDSQHELMEIGDWSEGPAIPPELEEILLQGLQNDPRNSRRVG